MGRKILAAAVLLILCACSTTQTPLQILSDVQFGYETAQAVYNGICSVNAPPSFCTDPQSVANYNKAKLAIDTALSAAKVAIELSNDPNSASVGQAIVVLQQAWSAYNGIVNTVQEKNAAIRGIAYHQVPL